MKTLLTLALLATISSCATIVPGYHSANIYGGVREFNDYSGIDGQPVYGGDVVVGLLGDGFGVEAGYLHSEDDSGSLSGVTSIDMEVNEFFVGVRMTLLAGSMIQPYIAVGATWLDADLDGTTTIGPPVAYSASDDGVGGYARVGAALEFGMLRVGLDARAVLGSGVDLGAGGSDLDYVQGAVFLGIGF